MIQGEPRNPRKLVVEKRSSEDMRCFASVVHMSVSGTDMQFRDLHGHVRTGTALVLCLYRARGKGAGEEPEEQPHSDLETALFSFSVLLFLFLFLFLLGHPCSPLLCPRTPEPPRTPST